MGLVRLYFLCDYQFGGSFRCRVISVGSIYYRIRNGKLVRVVFFGGLVWFFMGFVFNLYRLELQVWKMFLVIFVVGQQGFRFYYIFWGVGVFFLGKRYEDLLLFYIQRFFRILIVDEGVIRIKFSIQIVVLQGTKNRFISFFLGLKSRRRIVLYFFIGI